MMMKKIKVAVLSAALLGGALGIAAADPTGGSSRPQISAEKKAERKAKRDDRMTSLFEQIDANKDGKITKSELEAFAVKMADERFDKMDTNKTGAIDLAQFKAAKEQARGRFGRHHRHGVNKQDGTKL